jgi:serine/threonine protein kinase
MNTDQWKEIRQAFISLYGLDPERQKQMLNRLAEQNNQLAAELESLLRYDHTASDEGYLATPPHWGGNHPMPLPADHLPEGSLVGAYRIRQLIGVGGMGAVYLAERAEDYRQTVALKLIATTLTRVAIERFHNERQLLARLQHPNIVRLLDGGTTPAGIPYLVMEHISGEPIDAYCARKNLSIRERARLMELIARAVAYAHERGIVHRDLKPGNVLVTDEGVPKITDFGLARSIEHADSVSLTARGVVTGTPGYIAPEQIVGGPGRNLPSIDCYSLGAILYRLLVGRPPFEGETPLQMCMRASTEVPTSVRVLDRRIPQDLDTIVARALARDPAERIGAANQLAEQLRRFLNGEPLSIVPFSSWDWLTKWMLRHRKALQAWGATVGILLTILTGVLVIGHLRTEAQLRTIQDLLRSATLAGEEISESLPLGSKRTHNYFEEMVHLTEQALVHFESGETKDQLRYRAALAHHHLARSWEAFDPKRHLSRIIASLNRAVELLGSIAERHPDQDWYRYNLSRSLAARALARRQFDPEGSLADAREGLRVAQCLARDFPDNPDWEDAVAFQHWSLAEVLRCAERLDEASEEALRAMELAARLVEEHPEKDFYPANVNRANATLALIALARQDPASAEACLLKCLHVLEVLAARGQADHYWANAMRTIQGHLAILRAKQGDFESAEALLAQATDRAEQLAAAYPYRNVYACGVVEIKRNRVEVLQLQGRFEEARTLCGELLEFLEKLVAERPESTELRPLLIAMYRSGPVPELLNPARADELEKDSSAGQVLETGK